MKFKLGDQVIVTAGKDKGKKGEISRILPGKNRVVVKGTNLYKRHLKPRQGVEGGIFEMERPLPTSNVALIDPVAKVPTRIGYKLLPQGGKIRIAKKSGTELDKPASKTTPKSRQNKKTSSAKNKSK